MSILKEIDAGLRKVNSLLFRIILIFYSLTLLYRYSNCFSWKIYLITYVLYILFYGFLFKKKNWGGVILRLINDYAFIVIILYGKSLNDINIPIFLFLPLINTLNHSGEKRFTPFPFYLYLILLISIYILNNYSFSTKFLIPIVAISLINALFYIRLMYMDFSNNLYSIIEQFYQEKINIGKTHLILKRVMQVHSEAKLIDRFVPIENIILFKIPRPHYLQILISAKFIIKFDLNQTDLIQKLQNNLPVKNFPILLDNNISENNIFFKILCEEIEYVVFVSFKSKASSIGFPIYLNKILIPLFSKLTKVINVEFEIKDENKKYFSEIKQHLEDIDNAVNAIHFLNNKLSPITSYFSLLEAYDSLRDDQIKKSLSKLIEVERRKATSNILPITTKMNQMAEKATNQNIIKDTQVIKLRKLFSIIRTYPSHQIGIGYNRT